MRVLVTGSSGFVGKALVAALRKSGHEVHGFDASHGQSVLDLSTVKQAVKGKQAVFHLAAVLDETKPREMLEVNVKGTENLVEASVKASVEHFIYLSTVGVHGRVHGTVNEVSEINPETMYEASKARAEKIVWDSQEMLPVTIIRSALVLGPNEYWRQIIRLIEGGFPLIGSGKNRFQTIYLNDLVSALVFVLGRSECFGETYVVAGEGCPTLRELYLLIRRELGLSQSVKNIPVWFGKLLSYALLARAVLGGKKSVVLPQYVTRLVRHRCYDTSKIRALGWRPRYSIDEAVRETLKALES